MPSLNEVINLQKSGETQQAIAICKKIIKKDPRNAAALHLLAKLYVSEKKCQPALEVMAQAHRLNPSQCLLLLDMARLEAKMGLFDTSIQHYEELIQLKKDFGEAHLELGKLLVHLERKHDAVTHYQRMCEIWPQNAQVANECGIIAFRFNEIKIAVKAWETAYKLEPLNLDIQNNLSLAYTQTGALNRALELAQATVKQAPNKIQYWKTLANTYKCRRDLDSLFQVLEEMLKKWPNEASLYDDYGIALFSKKDLWGAIAKWKEGLDKFPEHDSMLSNMSIAYLFLDEFDKAYEIITKGLRISPENPKHWKNLGFVYRMSGYLDEALDALKKAVHFAPNNNDIYSNYLMTLNYLDSISEAEISRIHIDWGQRLLSKINPLPQKIPSSIKDRKIRLAYISPDLRRHSVTYFLSNLLNHHTREQFEISLYSTSHIEDDMTRYLENKVDHFTRLHRIPPRIAASIIQKDGIDILVDLAGHTPQNGLEIMAYKPAPIQVSWLGYPNTTGLTTIDYRISDNIADPVGTSDSHYTEKIHRLDHCFLCYRAYPTLPNFNPIRLKAPSNPIVFGSFNLISKITNEVIALWSEVLNACPESKLVLKSTGLETKIPQARLREQFAKWNISFDRIIIKNHMRRYEDHLNFYNEIDLCLDPFPYNGTTTTCEALVMGVPVITMRGNRHSARVGASLLSHAGFEDFITENKKDYVNKIVSLANDIPTLCEIRSGMRDKLRRSTLMNSKAFTHDMESAYIHFLKEKNIL